MSDERKAYQTDDSSSDAENNSDELYSQVSRESHCLAVLIRRSQFPVTMRMRKQPCITVG